ELDVIVIALPFKETDVLTKAVYEESFCVLLPAQHQWTRKKTIDSSMLNNKSLLLLGEGHCFRDQVLEACPTTVNSIEGESRYTTVEASSLETIRHMVASGLGVSVLPQSAIDSQHYTAGVIEIRPFTPPAPTRTVAIAWRASFPRPKAIDALVEAIRQCPLACQA